MKLYSMVIDYGRMGDVEAVFIAESIDSLIGKNVYFGEILGKHSDVAHTFDGSEFTVLSEESDKINWLFNITGFTVCGHNPFDYVEFDED